ncbi:MAG: hypothetical protein IT175_13275 [Acidobacteria bacterium]|nr:hypothetical protein [Acidobacteriota bacterium]
MDTKNLMALRNELEVILNSSLRAHKYRLSVDFPNSPNPLCFFEIEGPVFAQGSFWANDEFRIEAMNTLNGAEVYLNSGSYESVSDAISLVLELCARVTEHSGK